MQTRMAKIETIGISAAEAARMVGLKNASEFRKTFGQHIKPLPLPNAEIYSVSGLKKVFATLSGDAPAEPRDRNWFAREAERRVMEDEPPSRPRPRALPRAS